MSESNEGSVVTATGYSDQLSFDEAFRNAVEALPPIGGDVADWLSIVAVDSIAGEFGGIAGLSRLKVTVSTVRP